MERLRLRHRRTLWMALVAVFLVLMVSRVPTFAAELLGVGDGTCASDCDGSDDDGSDDQKRCPPNCPYGACAKVVQAVPWIPELHVLVPFETRRASLLILDLVVVRDCVNEIFHPPRADRRSTV